MVHGLRVAELGQLVLESGTAFIVRWMFIIFGAHTCNQVSTSMTIADMRSRCTVLATEFECSEPAKCNLFTFFAQLPNLTGMHVVESGRQTINR